MSNFRPMEETYDLLNKFFERMTTVRTKPTVPNFLVGSNGSFPIYCIMILNDKQNKWRCNEEAGNGVTNQNTEPSSILFQLQSRSACPLFPTFKLQRQTNIIILLPLSSILQSSVTVAGWDT
jgi:hypothetical protein